MSGQQEDDCGLNDTGFSYNGYRNWKNVRAINGFAGIDPEMGPRNQDERDIELDWLVHSILNDRRHGNGRVEFLIKWWPTSGQDGRVYLWENSWVNDTDMTNCQELLVAYRAGGCRKPVSAPGIGAAGPSNVSSKPYSRSDGPFGSAVSMVISEFSKIGYYSVSGGLRHSTDTKLTPLVGFDFVRKVFDLAFGFKNEQIYVLPRAVGKNVPTKKELNSYRKTELVPFCSASTASIDLAGALNKGFDCAVFLVIARKGIRGTTSDFHCVVGVIPNRMNRMCFCFNTTSRPPKMAHPPMDLFKIQQEMCSGVPVMMGYGTQNNTADCIERAMHFIGVVADGGNWMTESPTGWSPFIKTH